MIVSTMYVQNSKTDPIFFGEHREPLEKSNLEKTWPQCLSASSKTWSMYSSQNIKFSVFSKTIIPVAIIAESVGFMCVAD